MEANFGVERIYPWSCKLVLQYRSDCSRFLSWRTYRKYSRNAITFELRLIKFSLTDLGEDGEWELVRF